MPAQLIDGNALAKTIRAKVAARAARLTARGRAPGLTVILAGEDPASQVYVKHKVADCEASGVRSVLERYDANLPDAELLARIESLNANPAIHGILVQMKLPRHIAAHNLIETISPLKDVDGFHVQSARALMIGRSNTVGEPMAMPLLQANATVTICHRGTANIGPLTRAMLLVNTIEAAQRAAA